MNLVKRMVNPRKPRVPQTYSEAQLSGLRSSTSARRQATVERLRTAIETLHAKKQAVTVQSVYEECGLRYAAIYRNPEALALFRANSTHLVAKKKQNKRKPREAAEAMPASRDPLLNYKKPQLVTRLRLAQQQLLEAQKQQAVLAEAMLNQEARMAELEVKLAELEPYRSFVDQVRQRIRQEEHGRSTLDI